MKWNFIYLKEDIRDYMKGYQLFLSHKAGSPNEMEFILRCQEAFNVIITCDTYIYMYI